MRELKEGYPSSFEALIHVRLVDSDSPNPKLRFEISFIYDSPIFLQDLGLNTRPISGVNVRILLFLINGAFMAMNSLGFIFIS